jgi:hypothetical protein
MGVQPTWQHILMYGGASLARCSWVEGCTTVTCCDVPSATVAGGWNGCPKVALQTRIVSAAASSSSPSQLVYVSLCRGTGLLTAGMFVKQLPHTAFSLQSPTASNNYLLE